MADQDRSLGELLAELSRETGLLVRKEVELAASEIASKGKEAGGHAGTAAAGGALLHAGLLVLLGAVVVGLAQLGLQPWLAASIVAGATMATGYVLLNTGRSGLRRMSFVPRQTIETLKETAAWTTRQGA
jgi:hypothetical protein